MVKSQKPIIFCRRYYKKCRKIVTLYQPFLIFLGQIGGAGIIGFAIGYFLKKLAKFIIIGAGAIFALFAFAQSQNFIQVDWNRVSATTEQVAYSAVNQSAKVLEQVNAQLNTVDPAMMGMPAMFIVGLGIGLKKG